MRTTLLSLLFIFYGLNSHAQIVYTPFIPQENPPLLLETPRASPQPRSRPSTGINYSVPQVQNQSQIQEKIVRTTAYFLTQTGDCYKVPIRIALGSINAKVISYYEDIGYGGSWKDVAYGGDLQKCNSMLSQNELEKQFMYKAMVAGKWFYFDADTDIYPSTPPKIVYQSPEQYRQSQQQEVQINSTTAYYRSQSGEYYKVPIRVSVNGNSSQVISYYENSGLGGQWKDVHGNCNVEQCNSMFAQNDLEESFMYKAFVMGYWIYFDL